MKDGVANHAGCPIVSDRKWTTGFVRFRFLLVLLNGLKREVR